MKIYPPEHINALMYDLRITEADLKLAKKTAREAQVRIEQNTEEVEKIKAQIEAAQRRTL